MNIAFTKNSDVGFDPQLDPDHPVQCVDIGESGSYEPGDGQTWYVLSVDEYNALKDRTDAIWASVYG